jgi:hypothetical protein
MIYSGETIMSTEIKLLQVSQIDEASEILANAFNDDPVFDYFIFKIESPIRVHRLARCSFLKKNLSHP